MESFRRHSERHAVESSVTLVSPDGNRIQAFLTDLSHGGLGILSSVPLEKMQKGVKIIVHKPFSLLEPLEKEANLVWSELLDSKIFRAGFAFSRDGYVGFA